MNIHRKIVVEIAVAVLCLLVFALAGCGDRDTYWDKQKPMTNEEIGKAYSYCHSQGMMTSWHYNNRSQVVAIQCNKL